MELLEPVKKGRFVLGEALVSKLVSTFTSEKRKVACLLEHRCFRQTRQCGDESEEERGRVRKFTIREIGQFP